MGFLDRASSSFLSFSHSPEKRCSVLNVHINTSFLSASRQRGWSSLPVIPTKEVLMIRPSKIVYILACGVALGIGLSHQPTWAEDEMKTPHSESRVGGQAGQPYEQATYKEESAQTKERLHRQPGERIGGQAGQPYDHLKHDYESTHAKGRVGGEAGESYSPIQLE